VTVAEIELGQIAVRVGFADMVLQDREKALNGIGGDNAITFAAHILVVAVLDGACEAKFQPMPLYLAAIFLLGVVDDGSELQQIADWLIRPSGAAAIRNGVALCPKNCREINSRN
jgi:hypothetical protein